MDMSDATERPTADRETSPGTRPAYPLARGSPPSRSAGAAFALPVWEQDGPDDQSGMVNPGGLSAPGVSGGRRPAIDRPTTKWRIFDDAVAVTDGSGELGRR